MKTFFTSFAALAVLGLQNPGNLWSQTFQYTLQGEAYSNGSVVLPTQDGGFLLGGSSSDAPFSGGEAMIIKVSATGTEEWTIRMAGSTSEHVSDIVPTYDGNFIATGTTFSFNAAPYGNVLVFKFTPTGQVLWTKMYGGPGYDLETI
jgi:hypothetical protein